MVASGSSLNKDEVESLKGRCRVVVVNNGFRLFPWADVLYATDGRWWDVYRDAAQFAGLKFTTDTATAKRLNIHLVRLKEETAPDAHEMTLEPGLLGRGGNGGFQAINLALQFGARRLLLVGFDFCGDRWHDRHPEPLGNARAHTLEKWRKRLDAQAGWLKEIGAEVFNASRDSALAAFPKIQVGRFLMEKETA